jgi:hypothetical protein
MRKRAIPIYKDEKKSRRKKKNPNNLEKPGKEKGGKRGEKERHRGEVERKRERERKKRERERREKGGNKGREKRDGEGVFSPFWKQTKNSSYALLIHLSLKGE